MRQNQRVVLMWIVLIGVFLGLYGAFSSNGVHTPRPTSHEPRRARMPFSQLVRDVQKAPRTIRRVHIAAGDRVASYRVHGADGAVRHTYGPLDTSLLARLDQAGVEYELEPGSRESFWQSLLVSWLPMLVLLGIFLVFMRQLLARKPPPSYEDRIKQLEDEIARLRKPE